MTDALAHLTLVELVYVKDRLERWLRFGDRAYDQPLGPSRRVVGFAPGSVFAFVRWAANDYGTVASRIDIIRAVSPGEPYQTCAFVRPGGEILLHINGWPKVERVLQAIDAVETLGIPPADASPDHWRHVHHRLSAGHEPRAYSFEQHHAYRLRKRVRP